MMQNSFYFGDNLHILREYIPDESVDLIYLDPPFNSNATYNLLFRSPDKKRWSDAQIESFDDTWSWGDMAEAQFNELRMTPGPAGEAIQAFHRLLGESNMLAYLTMMAARLVELRRALKPTGSLYLHCDSTAGHYLKVLMDSIFGPECFRSDITWKRTYAHGNATRNLANVKDSIFLYSKGMEAVWNPEFRSLTAEEAAKRYPKHDADGRRWQSVTLRNPSDRPNLKYPYRASNGVTYHPHQNGWSCNQKRLCRYDQEGKLHFPKRPDGALRLKMYEDESRGQPITNLWDDIGPLSSHARERLGYPTQKPVALLERIIRQSSNEGDVVLDPFCGCGTTLHAAENLHRKWLGIDVAIQAMKVVGDRLSNEFPHVDYEVFGIPTSLESALWLAENDPFQFEEWAVLRVGGMHSGKYRGDGGIDGTFFFLTGKDEQKDASRGIISVKGGQSINPGMIRDLAGTLHREREWNRDANAIAVFICARTPTKGMLEEARSAGSIETDFGSYPAIQILSLDEIFDGASIRVPFMLDSITAAQAGRRKGKTPRYIDPRELARQRQFFFSMSGGSAKNTAAVMPAQLRKTG